MKEIMSRYTDKLPVIGTRSHRRVSPPSTRPVGRDQIGLPAIQSRHHHHAHAKLTKDQLTSDRKVRPSPCLPPLTNPRRHRDTRQTTFKGTHDQGPFKGTHDQGPFKGTHDQGPFKGTHDQGPFKGTHDQVETSFSVPKIPSAPSPARKEQTGNDNLSDAALKLQQLKEKLLRETEREEELKSLQKEDERYLEHLRKNLADLKLETDRTTRETREISAKSDEVRETMRCMRREMAEFKTKYTQMMYNNQRLQDACAKLDSQMTREMSEVIRNCARNVQNKMTILTVNAVENRSTRFTEQKRIALQEASLPIIPEAEKMGTQTGLPQVYVKATPKTKSRLGKLAARILDGRKKSEEGISTPRNESPIQFMKRKSKKFIGGFIGRNRVSPIPEED